MKNNMFKVRKMKRLIFLLFIFTLSCLVSVARDFSYTYEGQTLVYTVLDEEAKTCEIKAGDINVETAGNKVSGKLILPEQVRDGNTIYTLTRIGDSAFNNCKKLSGPLTIPTSVTSIGRDAFRDCSGLTGPLTIPNSVITIDLRAFSNCSGFTGPLTISNSVTSIGSRAFANCSGLTGSLTIPNSVTSIDKEAFAYCSGFTGPLTIPNSLTSIEESVFIQCSGLTGPLTIPNSVTSIGDHAFSDCSGLTGPLTIPNSVISIGIGAFDYCTGLTGLLIIPESVTSIGISAFSGCSGLTGPLTIPNSVTSIGPRAFSGCSGLTGQLTISNSVTEIYDHTFNNCRGLTGSLIIPNSVTKIGNEAFMNCTGLSEIYLPKYLEKIGDRAFSSQGSEMSGSEMNIERVYCEAQDPPTIGYEFSESTYSNSAFGIYTYDSATLIVPTECVELYKTAPLWRFFRNIKGDKEVDAVSIELNKTTVSLKVTETVQLTATILPETTSDKTVTWTSSDSHIATVNTKGLVTAVSVGTATITATSSNGLTASCNVSVTEISPSSIELNIKDMVLFVGQREPIQAKVLPEDTTDKSVTWSSSDTSIVSVDETGLVTAINVGNAVVTATTGNGLSAECIVTVVETPASEVIIDKESLGISGDDLEMRVGEVRTINVTVLPETATDKSVGFESSDPTVASVDSDGRITALSLGNTTVTVTAKSGVSASIRVTVVATPVETVTLNRTEASLKVSEQLQLEANVLPEDVTDRSVTWSSSNSSIVSVDETGLVTAINVGSAVVTATTSNGLSAECLVNVVETPVSEVIIDKEALGIVGDDLEMMVGEVRTINVTVLPETATDKNVSFNSSNPMVASVDERGVLTALTQGISVITVAANSGISTSFNVIVMNPAVGTVETFVSPLKVREGSLVSVSATCPHGGYESGWNWFWVVDGMVVSENLEFNYCPSMASGMEQNIEKIQFRFIAYDWSPDGSIFAQIHETTDYVSVYRQPLMPLQLIRKGDGSSHTFIVMSSLDDRQLADLGYSFTYGYTDTYGVDHIIETTPLRYCRTQEKIYNDPENKFWVYSEWSYDDGSVVTSGRRYLDGYADDDFDASVFDGAISRSIASKNPDKWIRPISNGVIINMLSDNDSRIDIFDMQGHIVRSCNVKGGCSYFETLSLDIAEGNVFIVRISSGADSVAKKIVIR